MRRLLAVAALVAVASALLVVVTGIGPADEEKVAPRRVAAVAPVTPPPASLRSFRVESARRAALLALIERRERPAGPIFPIRGRHDRGRYETNDFGGGRGHQGQDMFAACGTPLVAALGGVVKRSGSEGAGGNYAVISSRDGRDWVYMHLAELPLVKTGEKVATGERIGAVGDSGNADGCHLHFELWTAPGWYAGGEPIDTAKLLAAWDAAS